MTEPHEQDLPEQDEPLAPDEAEEAAEAEEAEPTPEPESEPEPSGLSERQWEDRFKKAEQRFATYARAIGTIFEEESTDLIPCPLCLGPVRGFVNKQAAGRLPQEQADLVKHFLGLARPVELVQSKRYKRCPDCDGHGQIATGSQLPGNESFKCEDCDGWGFVPPPKLPQNGKQTADALPRLTTPSVSDIANPDPDGLGQPRYLPDGRENPNWMRMPSAWVEVAPYGRTAGLTAQDAATTS